MCVCDVYTFTKFHNMRIPKRTTVEQRTGRNTDFLTADIRCFLDIKLLKLFDSGFSDILLITVKLMNELVWH